jgi:hypothetical protein
MNNPNWDDVAASRRLDFGMEPTVQRNVNCVSIVTQYKLITYLLTPRSTVLLEKLTGFQLVKKFPAFYGTRRFITAFTSARTNTKINKPPIYWLLILPRIFKGTGSNLYAITGYSVSWTSLSLQANYFLVPKIRHCLHSGLSPNNDTYLPSSSDDRACISTRSPPHSAVATKRTTSNRIDLTFHFPQTVI